MIQRHLLRYAANNTVDASWQFQIYLTPRAFSQINKWWGRRKKADADEEISTLREISADEEIPTL